MSQYSNASRPSRSNSRPVSHAFPIFHSSLPYALVRDFAYPVNHPFHYGPPPLGSGLSTPASESRRLSDPALASWDDSRGQWSATPPWFDEISHRGGPGSFSREKLPAMTFSDDHGPPYSEDEDLHSPVVTTSRHKKHKSSASGHERGRSPGDRGVFVGLNGDGSETYYVNEGADDDNANGPGGELVTYPPDQARHSHLLSPHYTNQTPSSSIPPSHTGPTHPQYDSEDAYSEDDDEDSSARYSRNYSFTIASPDEEMHGKAIALFDFTREHENELPLQEGQVILVSYRHGQGWLVAEDPTTGESGLVPEEFVRLLRDIEGGWGGLQNAQPVDPAEQDSPAQDGVDTPTAQQRHGGLNEGGGVSLGRHTPNVSNGSQQTAEGGAGGKEKHPPVQSSFSTSRTDFEKREKEKENAR
ncbi:MAG: hypothetical protein Q9227_000046 [Pyrenula ochraceoflavens]